MILPLLGILGGGALLHALTRPRLAVAAVDEAGRPRTFTSYGPSPWDLLLPQGDPTTILAQLGQLMPPGPAPLSSGWWNMPSLPPGWTIPGGIPGLPSFPGLPSAPPPFAPPGATPGIPLQAVYLPVDPASAIVTLRPGDEVAIAASSDAPELQQPAALALAATEAYRRAGTPPTGLLVVAAPPQALPGGLSLSQLVAGKTLLLGTLRAFPGSTSAVTYPRVVRDPNLRVEAQVLARRGG